MKSSPLVVLGGYLGTGKTTLVNHLLYHARGRRIAVLVNDFGSISIDAELVEGAYGDVLALAGGCVCCSFGADLVGALQRQTRVAPLPDLILLECSGVGLPAAVARTAALVPEVNLQGIVVLVDTAQVLQHCQDRYVGDTVHEQLRQAHLLVRNQQDRCTEPEVARVEAELQRLCPGTPQVGCSFGRLHADLILDAAAIAPPANAIAVGRPFDPSPAALQQKSGLVFFEEHCQGPIDPAGVAAGLQVRTGGRLLRAKGIVKGLDDRWWSVQVMGSRCQFAPLASTQTANTGVIACIAVAEP